VRVINITPSDLNLAAYLAMARLTPALDMPYPKKLAKFVADATAGEPAVVEMVRHFLVLPERRSGRKAFVAWIGPIVFVLNCKL
jgi:hypothetical protein